jgi:hypothetical protein
MQTSVQTGYWRTRYLDIYLRLPKKRSLFSFAGQLMKSIRSGAIAAVVAAILSIAATGCFDNVRTNAVPGDSGSTITAHYDALDAFQDALAKRAGDRIGRSDDFKVHVTQARVDIGTLLRKGTTIPINDVACLPEKVPRPMKAFSLFPSYSLSKSLAINLGLDDTIISRIADFGIKYGNSGDVNLSVADQSYSTLTDDQLRDLMASKKCLSALPPGTAIWLVRGYIGGKRSFSFANALDTKVSAKVEKVGTFEVNPGSRTESVKITDDSDTDFLQIVSEITRPATSGPAAISSPKADATLGRVYIQRDQADNSGAAGLVSQALSSQSFSVVRAVESIASDKMPLKAQVRYFNADDRASAERALQALKQQYPDAILQRVGIPAPKNQLEVWLPRVASG